MKVLVLTRYNIQGASSRLRFLQYIPYLEKQNLEFKICPLFEHSYLNNLYKNDNRNIRNLIISYVRRILLLSTAKRYNLIWLEKELLPMFPAIFERLLGILKIPYIVDFDDPTFHFYDLNKSIIKILLGNKIKTVIRNASIVTVGNEYLLKYAKEAGSEKVIKIPTVIDLNDYPLSNNEESDSFIVGWIGSPSGFKYIKSIQSALKRFFIDYDGYLEVVSNGNFKMPGIPYKNKIWNEKTQLLDINRFSVGIIPLLDTPWEKGKCGFKLIQYMGCSKPVIASPVGINLNVVTHKKNGFLANTENEWYEALVYLKTHKKAGISMGEMGRKLVENKFSLQIYLPKVMEIFKKYDKKVK